MNKTLRKSIRDLGFEAMTGMPLQEPLIGNEPDEMDESGDSVVSDMDNLHDEIGVFGDTSDQVLTMADAPTPDPVSSELVQISMDHLMGTLGVDWDVSTEAGVVDTVKKIIASIWAGLKKLGGMFKQFLLWIKGLFSKRKATVADVNAKNASNKKEGKSGTADGTAEDWKQPQKGPERKSGMRKPERSPADKKVDDVLNAAMDRLKEAGGDPAKEEEALNKFWEELSGKPVNKNKSPKEKKVEHVMLSGVSEYAANHSIKNNEYALGLIADAMGNDKQGQGHLPAKIDSFFKNELPSFFTVEGKHDNHKDPRTGSEYLGRLEEILSLLHLLEAFSGAATGHIKKNLSDIEDFAKEVAKGDSDGLEGKADAVLKEIITARPNYQGFKNSGLPLGRVVEIGEYRPRIGEEFVKRYACDLHLINAPAMELTFEEVKGGSDTYLIEMSRVHATTPAVSDLKFKSASPEEIDKIAAVVSKMIEVTARVSDKAEKLTDLMDTPPPKIPSLSENPSLASAIKDIGYLTKEALESIDLSYSLMRIGIGASNAAIGTALKYAELSAEITTSID